MTLELKIKRLHKDAVIPFFATGGSAGLDLTAVEHSVDRDAGYPYVTHIYNIGLAVEIPKGYVGLLFPRSSVSNKSQILANCVGVIDSDYRGPIIMKFKGVMDEWEVYNSGDRVGQLVIMELPEKIEIKEVDALSITERGEGGYGSTGK